MGWNTVWARGYLDTLHQYGLVFLSPGVSPDQPEIVQARDAGAEFGSEIDVVLHLARCTVVGDHWQLRQDHNNHSGWQDAGAARKRPRARPAGAGGRQHRGPLVEQVLDVEPDDLIVLELSSFQLKPLRVSPDIAAVLNITPNHLDVHPSMEDYIWSKGNIVRHQSPEDWAVLGRR